MSTSAQVTIGMDAPPVKAALLDLKTQEAITPSSANDNTNVTSNKGGLLLPRVKLKDKHTLEPFIPVSDPDWTNSSATKIKEVHAGLTVYNLTSNVDFVPGMYTWDGQKWTPQDTYHPYGDNGLTRLNDTVRLGGNLTGATTVDMSDQPFNISGTGTFNIASSLNMLHGFKYTYGQPGKGKVLISDDSGNATWQNNNALPTTPSVVFDSQGASFNPDDITGEQWANTKVALIVPPGKWFVMVSILAKLENGEVGKDAFWFRTSFIKENENKVNNKYFIGDNNLISARIYPGLNIISGYVLMKNESSSPVKFYYKAGRIERIGQKANKCNISKLGSTLWGENSIVAFALY
jgi:hypothetical protein